MQHRGGGGGGVQWGGDLVAVGLGGEGRAGLDRYPVQV
jgi:hypothetical protein